MQTQKLLMVVVVLLVAVLSGVAYREGWFGGMGGGRYHAVYLETGDMYFGTLRGGWLSTMRMDDAWLLQVNQENKATPFSLTPLKNAFWGPKGGIEINRAKVVWTASLDKDGQVSAMLNDPARATAATAPQSSVPAAVTEVQTESKEPAESGSAPTGTKKTETPAKR